jgi:hypothetical protein
MRSKLERLRYIGRFLTESRKANELVELVKTSRTVLSSFAKAKTAKLGESIYLDWHKSHTDSVG